jgi:ribosomal protein S18 acetylase RimI-like enzyme
MRAGLSVQEALSSTKKSIATLHVDPLNKAAIALYHSLGFELDGVLEDYYSAGRPAHKLRKQLDNF